MTDASSPILREVASYYTGRLKRHGETPAGVDWNGAEGQRVRFEQLCRVIDEGPDAFSLADIGCGYGSLLDHLGGRYAGMRYLGVDVSEAMVAAATERFRGRPDVSFQTGASPGRTVDYCVASGIFNVRQERSDAEWEAFLMDGLEVMDACTRKGFAFNCLTSYSDEDHKRPDLYYADPLRLFDFCKRTYARNVALLHDYGLYEFTILVRKDE